MLGMTSRSKLLKGMDLFLVLAAINDPLQSHDMSSSLHALASARTSQHSDLCCLSLLQRPLGLFDEHFSNRTKAMEQLILDCAGHAKSLQRVHQLFMDTANVMKMEYGQLQHMFYERYGGKRTTSVNKSDKADG